MQKITLLLLIRIIAVGLFTYSASSKADEVNLVEGASDLYYVTPYCLENPQLPECLNYGYGYANYGYGSGWYGHRAFPRAFEHRGYHKQGSGGHRGHIGGNRGHGRGHHTQSRHR